MHVDHSAREAESIQTERVLTSAPAAISCAQCRSDFTPRRPTQAFCCDRCRKAYHTDRGIEGTIAGVRRTKSGASVTVHLSGPAAEAAMGLAIGRRVRLVP